MHTYAPKAKQNSKVDAVGLTNYGTMHARPGSGMPAFVHLSQIKGNISLQMTGDTEPKGNSSVVALENISSDFSLIPAKANMHSASRSIKDASLVREVATQSFEGSGRSLPHLSIIQKAFGHNNLQDVRAYIGETAGRAAESIGAKAFTIGNRIAFREPPDLRTAAHEAAHVV